MKLNLSFTAKLFAIACLITNAGKAQVTFQKTYGTPSGEYFYDMQKTYDGGYILGGTSTGILGPRNSSYIVKTDANGDTLWTVGVVDTCSSTSPTNGQYVNDIIQTFDHGYLSCGGKTAVCEAIAGGGNIVKMDSTGKVVWAKYCTAGEDPYPCIQDKAGNYIVGGYLTGLGAGAEDGCLMKLNKNGDTIWSRTYGGAANEWFYRILQTKDGGYLASGFTSTFGAGANDIYIVKTDSNSNVKWSKTYGTARNEIEFGHGLEQTKDGGYIITGSEGSGGTGAKGVILMKIDSVGNLKWSNVYDGTFGHAVKQTPDGGYAVVGSVTGTGVFLLKTDSVGKAQWAKVYGSGSGGYQGFFLQLTNDGGYALGGQEVYTTNFKDAFFIKTDANGVSGCSYSVYASTDSAIAYTVTSPTTLVGIGPNTISYPTRVGHGGAVNNICSSVSVPEVTAMKENVSIYPNPVQYSATIVFDGSGTRSIEVYDITGRKINGFESKYETYSMPCNGLQPGVYFVKVKSDVGTHTVKFIKE